MKVIITRTSEWDRDPNCKEAKKEILNLTYLDYRTVNSLSEGKRKPWFDQWYKGGSNHRRKNGMIVCDVLKKLKCYTIEIKNLRDLLRLHKKYDNIIIKKSDYKEFDFELEIYNSYRE